MKVDITTAQVLYVGYYEKEACDYLAQVYVLRFDQRLLENGPALLPLEI
jgi:hypothetical protein